MYSGCKLQRTICLWLVAFLTANAASKNNLRILVLLPQTEGTFKFAFGAEMSGAAVTIAVDDINSQGGLGGHNLTVDYANTKCNAVQGIGVAAAMMEQYDYTALIGPQCSQACNVVAKLAAYRNVPCFSGVCQDTAMQNKNEFKTLTRFLGSFNMIGQAVTGLLLHHDWMRFGMISERHQDKVWILSRDGILEEASNNNMTVSISRTYKDEQQLSLETILHEVAAVSRIIVLVVRGETLRSLMLLAHDMGLLDGSYMFIDIYYYRAEMVFGDFSWKKNDTLDSVAREAYKSILFVSYFTPLTEDYTDFQNEVKRKSMLLFNYSYSAEDSIPYPAANLYEAMWMLGLALNETIEAGQDISDGFLVSRRLWARSITSVTGTVTLNSNGDREQGYTMYQTDHSHTFHLRVIGSFFSHTGTFQPDSENAIRWPAGKTSPPLDTPVCGYFNELCDQGLSEKDRLYITVSSLLGCLGLVILLSGIVICAVTRYMKSKANEMLWRVRTTDIKFSLKSRVSMSRSMTTMRTEESGENCDTVFTKSAFYKGSLVAVKQFENITPSFIDSSMKDYRQLKELSHPNVCRILGICIDIPSCFVLTEYCSKGSLEDILENDHITLDLAFRYSLIWDILRGLLHIHGSHLKFHGNLKSSNCLVDGRFVVKLADFGPRGWLAAKQRQPRELLWTAPEILRDRDHTGLIWPKGDVYALGIILQEIVTRCGVFSLNGEELSVDEIVTRIASPNGKPLRPALDEKQCASDLKKLIERCWAEDPISRPTLKQTMAEMTEIGGDRYRSGNIFDNLLARMEQYANNLESLVEERTSKYIQERKRAEDLLGRLLPSTIAREIQEKGFVDPVSFESVTICFTDIVGFTSISAESTPLQIVAMLNDLYSRFDDIIDEFDAYKVETIGDAYMVVSGLPNKNNNHATIMASLTLELISAARVFRIRHFPERPLLLRAGLHTGSCVAGVIGLKMPRYCLFGDTVNTASRMESTGEALKIQVSHTTGALLQQSGNFLLEERGGIQVKGKGNMTTYWLTGKVNEENQSTLEENEKNIFKS